MKKMILFGLLFLMNNEAHCSLLKRLVPAVKIGALPGLLIFGIGANKQKVVACVPQEKTEVELKANNEQSKGDEEVFSYADALAKYPFTTRLLMHRYRHFYNEYQMVKGEECGGFSFDLSSISYTKRYRDYWKVTKVLTSQVICHSGEHLYWSEIDRAKAKPKKVAAKLLTMFDASENTRKSMDACTVCTRAVDALQCVSTNIPESLKRVVRVEYQKQTRDLQRDVWDDAHKPTERSYSLPA